MNIWRVRCSNEERLYLAAEWLVQISLGEATVQELHLELLRRTNHNRLDGARIANDLLKHRDLWRAVLLDTYGLESDGSSRLIKLRDLAGNIFNVDALYILAMSPRAADQLAEFAEAWFADTTDILNLERTENALGDNGMEEDMRLVVMWWD